MTHVLEPAHHVTKRVAVNYARPSELERYQLRADLWVGE